MPGPWASRLLFLVLSLHLWSDNGLASPLTSAVEVRAEAPGHARYAPPHDQEASTAGPSRLKRGPTNAGPKYVFRGLGPDMPPAEVKKKGGLFPNNVKPESLTADAYRVLYHQQDGTNEFGKNSAYVSTTTSFDVAAWFAQRGGYVYVIKTTPNMFPVESTVDNNPLPWEREYTALGGVRFEQIAQCFFVPPNAKLDLPAAPQWKLKTHEDVSRNMEQLQALVDKGVLQPQNNKLSYDRKFDLQSASPGQPQLAGYIPGADALDKEQYRDVDAERPTWKYAKEFLESIGAGRGWSDRFPLFQNPIHVAAIKEQEQEAARRKGGVAESSSGVDYKEVMYEMTLKPFGDLVEAVRSDRKVSVGEWLGILGAVGLELIALAPTPVAVGWRALRFARAGYRASQAIKKGAKAAEGAGNALRAARAAERVSKALDTKLNSIEAEIPSLPSKPLRPGGKGPPVKQPMSSIAKIADNVRVRVGKPRTSQGKQGTSALDSKALEEMLKKLDAIKIPDEPLVPVMAQVVKEAGKKATKPMAVLDGRSGPGPKHSLADALQQFAAAKQTGESVPMDILDIILDKVEEILDHAIGKYEAYDSFLKSDELWLMLEKKLSEVEQ